MSASIGWAEGRARLAAPVFDPIRPALERLPSLDWPGHEALTRAAEGVRTAGGAPVRFVPPRERGSGDRRHYELRIAETGEVETRPRNWHDLFNALAWIAFPESKATINAGHVAALEAGGEAEARRRGPRRDALTLFDEGGVVVASASPELLKLIEEREWKALFWHRRAEVEGRMRFLAFGHALCEQALEPFIGMVAKSVFLAVEAPFLDRPVAAMTAEADGLLARALADRARLASPGAMAPLPVLGIPGWYPGSSSEAFYDDRQHFRGKPPASPVDRGA